MGGDDGRNLYPFQACKATVGFFGVSFQKKNAIGMDLYRMRKVYKSGFPGMLFCFLQGSQSTGKIKSALVDGADVVIQGAQIRIRSFLRDIRFGE